MNQRNRSTSFSPQEQVISVLPAALAGIVLLLATLFLAIRVSPDTHPFGPGAVLVYGLVGSLYLGYFHMLYLPTQRHREAHAWLNAAVSGLAIGLLQLLLLHSLHYLLGLVVLAGAISLATVAGRGQAYLQVVLAVSPPILLLWAQGSAISSLAFGFGLSVTCVVATETILQLKAVSRRQIHRLELVNEFSRQISSSLDSKQVLTLLDATIQNALEADTYYVGLVQGEQLHFGLLCDDGEYFQNASVELDGTLSGWVIRNNKGLFLPDLRQDVDLPGVRHVIIGKDRTSLSWMGVPVHGGIVAGAMAIGSYHPNAFDQSDMELLSNMAGHAALALDNAFRHAEVEEQSYVDSLTGAYNHRHFLRLLAELGDAARDSGEPLSLIMLDVDHFKQYNDRYGHLAGDAVLRALCHTIKSHLKRTDVLGRWGGEEFAIALPNARGDQACQIADRIRGTMANLEISGYQDKTFPAPTVSQGIAEYPSEVPDVIGLVDRADHRLYVAKARGRDQVEPGPTQPTVSQTVQTAGTGMSGRMARFRF